MIDNWPTSIPLTVAHVLRSIRREQGEAWLEMQFPDVSPEDRRLALSVCRESAKDSVPVIHITPPLRYEFAAAAYVLGATLSQLSAVLGLARGTIHQGIRRRTACVTRRPYRLKMEAVEVLWRNFQSHVRATPTLFDGMSIEELAKFLEAGVDLKEDW